MNVEAMVNLTLDNITNANTKRAYTVNLRKFLAWYGETGSPRLSRRLIHRHIAYLRESGRSHRTVNIAISAIRKMVTVAVDFELLSKDVAYDIMQVGTLPLSGKRTGRWLSFDECQRLHDAPDTSTLKGKRDKALLVVLTDTGLRRSELAKLSFHHLQKVQGRWMILNLISKNNQERTIPVNDGVMRAIEDYQVAAGLKREGRVFRAMQKGDKLLPGSEGMSTQAIRSVVAKYGAKIDIPNLAPHDLRRTYATLSRIAGASREQIAYSMGHKNVGGAKSYLDIPQDFANSPSDKLQAAREKGGETSRRRGKALDRI